MYAAQCPAPKRGRLALFEFLGGGVSKNGGVDFLRGGLRIF